jgi:PAS domain S-box-containing protein
MNWRRILGLGSSQRGEASPRPREGLQAPGQHLRPLLDAVPGVAVVLAPDGRIVEFNREAEQVYGKSRDDVLGRDYYALFLPDQDRESVAADIAKVLSGQPSRGFENPIRGADGEERHFAWYVNRLTNEDGEATGIVAVGLETTGRKRAEEELLREKQFSESAIAGMPGIFYFFDDQGNLLKWNRHFEEVTGYSSQTITEMIPTDFFVGDDKQRIADTIAEAFSAGSAQTEADLVTRDGQAIPHYFTALRLDVGGKNHLLGLGIDISDRKRSEEALAKRERYYRAMLFSMHEDIIVIDRDRRITDMNHRNLASSGTRRNQIIGRHCFEVSHGYNEPCGLHDVQCPLEEVFETGEPRNCMHDHLRADGSGMRVDILMSPMKDDTGRVTHVIEAVRDVSDLFEAQDALRASEEWFRAVVEQAGDGLILVDPDGRIVDANRSTCEGLGYTRDELLSLTIDAVDADVVLGAPPVPTVMSPGEFLTVERRHRRKDGSTFPVEVRMSSLRIGGKPFVLGLARDITERKRAEKRIQGLNRLEESLLAAGALEDKIELITDGLVAIFGADFARIWLIGPGDRCHAGCTHAALKEGPHVCRNRERCLHLAASSGRYTHLDGDMHQRVPLGCYKIGRVAAAEEPGFVTKDVANDPRVHDRDWARQIGLVSFAGYKLSAPDGAPMGVLGLFSQHTISPDEAGLLETVAGIASQVIRTARAEQEHKHLIGVLELTTDLVSIATPEGRITYVNRAGREMLGWGIDEDVTSKMIPALHPKWAAEKILAEGIRDAIGDGVWRGETAVLNRAREEVPVSQVIVAHRSPSGKLEYLSSTMRDVRERKRAEEQRQEHVRFLENLERVDRAVRQAADLDQLLQDTLEAVLSILGCDRVWLLHPCDPEAPTFRVPMEITRPEYPGAFALNTDIPMISGGLAICSATLASETPLTFGPDGDHPLDRHFTDQFQVQSLMAMAIHPKDGKPWALGVHQCSHPRVWTEGEKALLQEAGRRLADGLSSLLMLRDLRDREANLQSIFRAAPVGIGLSIDRMLKQFNDRVCEMVGRSREELIGQCARILYPSDEEFGRFGHESSKSIPTGGTGALEVTWMHKDGHPVDILLSWTQFDPADRSSGFTFVALDITKRKQAERRESEARRVAEAVAEAGLQYLETARVQSMAALIVERALEIIGAEMGFVGERLSDGSLRLLAVSDMAWMALKGGSLYDHAREAINESGGYVMPRTDNVLFRPLETGEVLMSDAPAHEPDWRGIPEGHPSVYSLLLVPLKVTNEVVGLLGVANRPEGFSEANRRDLESFAPTAALAISRWRSEQERRNLEDQLRQSQKMEAVGQLAGGVAHDFNNLLQAIHGYTFLAMSDLSPESDGHAYVEEVMKAAERAAALTQQLLAFSRRQVIQPKAVDLNQAVSDMIRMLQRVIGEHIELNVMLGQHVKPVHADTGQIGQVLVNLCVNARDAMVDGGRLTIETRNATLDAAFSESHPWAAEGDYGLIAVTDTGIGMAPEVRLRVFEPFFTTKEIGHGTGLGLATVYGIVKQHGGLLDVSSEPGRGSRFNVYLPLASDNVADEETQAPEPLAGGTETILLAEDEEVVRNMATEVLERVGYTVIVACDGEEAAALFQEHADEVALALLDVVMPKMSGRAACEKMRALKPDLPILFSSGYSFSTLGGDFLERTGAQAIPKPYAPRDLLKKVREALDHAISRTQRPRLT